MAYLRFTLWIALLFYEIQFLRAENVSLKEIAVKFLDAVESLKENPAKSIVKRDTHIDALPSTNSLTVPQIFKFELNDAKEPDEETKKLIQNRARQLELEEKNIEIINGTLKRSKRATQKVKPQLIPFLISDAREPDSATKELIRRSRAKELSLTSNDERIREINPKGISTSSQKRETVRQNRSKVHSSQASNKDSLRQGRVKSFALTTLNNESLRPGKVESVFLTTADEDSLKQKRPTDGISSAQHKKRSNQRLPKKRIRRFAQLTEPRFIKFELHDAKEPDSTTRTEVQILPRPMFGAKISNQKPELKMSHDPQDSSTQDSKFRYFIQHAPRKPQFGAFPKRNEHNDVVFRVSKMQKYIATGQGLEDINTNIEISIPPAVKATAILSGNPHRIYGQKICPYGTHGCQVGPVAPMHPVPQVTPVGHVAQVSQVIPITPVAHVTLAPSHQEFVKPVQNSVAENEVLPEQQHQQRYYYHFYPQPQPVAEHQQFVPIAKPYQIVHAHVIEQPQIPHEPQIEQNLIDSTKLPEQTPTVKVAYIQPTYAYGTKLYPDNEAKDIQAQPAKDQSFASQYDVEKDLEELQHKNNIQSNQLESLKSNQEFQDLSSLLGKSPVDQMHGISYLLAKEMQRQKIQRPQDQTSPILFHPKENANDFSNSQLPSQSQSQSQSEVQQQNFEDQKLENINQIVPFEPLKPVQKVQPVVTSVYQHIEPQARKVVNPHAANEAKAIGLSPNYNGIDSHIYKPQKIYSDAENDSALEYASKYAFGYRVRDFDSGNDFSHKQNRDADGVTRGQYHILMPDGRIQNVVYYADDTGFHADILMLNKKNPTLY